MTMSISRRDVSSDYLQNFPLESRFIKLDAQAYLELLGIWDTINRPQIALINAVNNPKYRFIVAALSRRVGKTYISNVIGQLVTLVPDSHVLIMSPNYSLSSISFDLQRNLIRQFDLEVAKNNVKDKTIELSNGSSIRMGAISTVNASVGRSYDLIIFDEAAIAAKGEAAFNVALRPTLDKNNSKAIFISTPRGKLNWFSKFYNRGLTNKFPMWCSIHADYLENSRMSEEDVQEARNSMSAAEFAQEYLASFTVFSGQIYHFPQENIKEFTGGRYEAFAGLDPGYKDPTAYIVLTYDPDLGTYHVVDEYLSSKATTAEHAAVIKEFDYKWDVDAKFIDYAAAQFGADLAHDHDITTIRAKKDILPGIAYVQTLIEQKKLFVAPHCTNTLAMLDQYRWDPNALSKEKPLHDEYSHMADALRYALYTIVV